MNRQQHLLIKLNEECSEVQQVICDILNDHEGCGVKHVDDLHMELHDLIAVISMLKDDVDWEHNDVVKENMKTTICYYQQLSGVPHLDYFATALTRRCARMQQIICKALIFGLGDVNPKTGITNTLELKDTYIELCAVLDLIGPKIGFILNRERIKTKQLKVEKWFNYAKSIGTVI